MRFKDYISESRKYDEFVNRLSAICRKKGYSFETIGKVGSHELYLVRINEQAQRTIAFIGTVHGDEVAGVYSILNYLEHFDIPKNVRILALPLGNPRGFERNSHTATGRLNINRQFDQEKPKYESGFIKNLMTKEKIDFFHSIHEDDDAKGFYLYYQDRGIESEVQEIMSIAEKHMPIDSRKTIYGDPTKPRGQIFVDKKIAEKDIDSLETWIYVHAGVNYVCTETPSTLPLETRVKCENEIMQYVIQNLERFVR